MLAFMGYSTAAPKYNMSVLVVAAGVWGTVGVIDNVDSMYLDSWPPDVGSYSWGYTFVGLVAGPSVSITRWKRSSLMCRMIRLPRRDTESGSLLWAC